MVLCVSVSQLGKSLFQSSLSFPSDISASSTHCTAGQQHYYTLHLKYFPLSLIELGSWSSSSSSFSRPWKERSKMKTKNGWQRSLTWEREEEIDAYCTVTAKVMVKKEGLSIVFQSNCSYLYSKRSLLSLSLTTTLLFSTLSAIATTTTTDFVTGWRDSQSVSFWLYGSRVNGRASYQPATPCLIFSFSLCCVDSVTVFAILISSLFLLLW